MDLQKKSLKPTERRLKKKKLKQEAALPALPAVGDINPQTRKPYSTNAIKKLKKLHANAEKKIHANFFDKMIRAAKKGRLDKINDVNVQDELGWTALMWACRNGHLDVVNRLLDCKEIDVNLQNEKDRTALMLACGNEHWKAGNRLGGWNEIDVDLLKQDYMKVYM